MKESKKREASSSKKKKHSSGIINLESWDQTDLEDADEKVLEKRLLQLKKQLEMAQDETPRNSRHTSSSKHKKRRVSEEMPSSDSDSSVSDSSFSSASTSSVRYKSKKKSSSFSEDGKKKYQRSPVLKKKFSKETKISRNANSVSKASKKNITRRKASPVSEKSSSRPRPRKSPSLDKRDLYNRLDTGRWHDKAKEFEKERTKIHENDGDRFRSRNRERNRSLSGQRESRIVSRPKEERVQKKPAARVASSVIPRRKDSPDVIRSRAVYDTGRRTALVTRKISPRDERPGRHDDRRPDPKLARRNDVRLGDFRDVSLRITRDVRERKEPIPKLPPEKVREREVHREVVDHVRPDRDRSKVNEDRFNKDRDNKRVHDRLEADRNVRSVRNESRDLVDDKGRRNERPLESTRAAAINRHPNESVFDRIRNRYNDRRNAENQKLGRERIAEIRKDRPAEKEPVKSRNVEANGGTGVDRLARDRRPHVVASVRGRSLHRDRKDADRNAVERRSPANFDRKLLSPAAARKSRDADNRTNTKRKSTENEDSWAKKKGINKVRSRSHSSEKRKRRRSSQEEWRVIDMTSPVLDDEFSDNNGVNENNGQNKLKRTAALKLKPTLRSNDVDDEDGAKLNKTILTDELSDISDEDFNDVSVTNAVRNRKDVIGRTMTNRNDKFNKKTDKKIVCDRNEHECDKTSDAEKHLGSDVDDLIRAQKLTDEENDRMDLEKGENFDSEEETVSRVSDALGVDWADLVEESKKKVSGAENDSSYVRKRWKTAIILADIGVSEKYAGEELFNEIQNDLAGQCCSENINAELSTTNSQQKITHGVPALHVYLKNRATKRQTLFEPYKTAISARKDIAIRRRLCGLPVKNLHSQQMLGICHWIV